MGGEGFAWGRLGECCLPPAENLRGELVDGLGLMFDYFGLHLTTQNVEKCNDRCFIAPVTEALRAMSNPHVNASHVSASMII